MATAGRRQAKTGNVSPSSERPLTSGHRGFFDDPDECPQRPTRNSCIDRAVRRSDHPLVMVGHAQVPDRRSASTVPLGNVRQVVARIILVAFVMTFMAARVLVFLIVSRRIPDLFLHVGGTHIHHLNYGIFLLSGVGAYLLLMRPARSAAAGGRRRVRRSVWL